MLFLHGAGGNGWRTEGAGSGIGEGGGGQSGAGGSHREGYYVKWDSHWGLRWVFDNWGGGGDSWVLGLGEST